MSDKPWPRPTVKINIAHECDGAPSEWTLYVFSPAPHCPEWTAYTTIRFRGSSPSGIYFCGTAIVTAVTLDAAKRAAIRRFKRMERK